MAVALAVLAGVPFSAAAQGIRGIVVDQTGLPLPGATLQLLDRTVVTATLTTEPDGTFIIDNALEGSTLVVSLDGFENATVPRSEATRIVLELAHTRETTDVVAPSLTTTSPTTPLLGRTLTAATVARLPSSRMRARESLPLLPSVMRGPDGLLQVGGARPHESPLLLDGFDVTDPATGTTSINLPFEAVRGIEVRRDPMGITYGGLLGSSVQIETRPGGDRRTLGVQGFIPRPRFTNPGFGRLEGIFPRLYIGGSGTDGRVRYFTAAEYDFERIPVPDVTEGSGPNLVEKSAVVFGRFDVQMSKRDEVVIEAFAFSSATDLFGLSPRREEAAATNSRGTDLFAGVTNRYITSGLSVVTIKFGVLSHRGTLSPGGTGASYLSPAGWRGNWFSRIGRNAERYSLMATWERTIIRGRGTHDLTLTGGIGARRLRGTVSETPVLVEDDLGRLVRSVEFGAASSISGNDRPHSVALRNVWTANERFQVDSGIRLDRDGRHGGLTPSARGGFRFALDEGELTVVKAGIGDFVGVVPLAVDAFSGYPTRIDRHLDPASGTSLGHALFQPAVGRLHLPRAVATTFQIERELRPGLDAQVGFTNRVSRRLAMLDVPDGGGTLAVSSTGGSTYRELQVSARKAWDKEQQAFVSYVRSYSSGELNDFAALFQTLDAPLLHPGGRTRLATDARDRVIGWGTFNLPRKFVVSPVVEWHSGFRYSTLDVRHRYLGEPNSAVFPAFVSMDLVAYKTVAYRKRAADLGIQLFNVTNHFNPRDVYPVAGARRHGQFTNSVGTILRGFMLVKW